MSLVITDNNPYINFYLESSNDSIITTAYANSLRRILLTSIKSLGFKYIPYKHLDNYIIINENSSNNIHNDKLSKRISLLTINTPCIKLLILIYLINNEHYNDKTKLKLYNIQNYLEKIIFKINVTNKSQESSFVTTNDIDIFLDDVNLLNLNISKITDFQPFEYFTDLVDLIELLKQNKVKDFVVNIRNKIFNHIEIDDNIYPKLLTELNHNEKLVSSMKLSIGKNIDDVTWDVVSSISYSFEKDYEQIAMNLNDMVAEIDDKLGDYQTNRWDNIDTFKLTKELIEERNQIEDTELRALIKEKDLLIQRYNIHDSYRIFKKNDNRVPSKFNLSFKYEGVHNNRRILYKSFKELKNQIKDFKGLFKNVIAVPYQDDHIKILYSENLEDAIDIYVEKSTHTIMNLINDYLYYLIVAKEDHYYTAYNRTHKLSDKYLLRLICGNFKEDILKVCDYLIKMTDDIIKNNF
jgi:DNA-directed RNA polymerase subunit L